MRWALRWVLTIIPKLDALGQDALEVSSLIRSVTNRLAPINKLPNEVLALIPCWFGDPREREKIVVTLTHVCRAWRRTFISCASLWTNFYCTDTHKTRVYLERSKSSPINLWLKREKGPIPDDPFLELAPHVIGRLQRLDVESTSDHLQTITQHLVQPAPLLKSLTINCSTLIGFEPIPILTTKLFDGDLSSLNELHIRCIRTQLPWRGMNNLTSLSLAFVTQPTPSVGQFLDFFESAPRLLVVDLVSATPAIGTQDRRSVALAHLRRLTIYGFHPPAVLLNHLIIPVGAETSIQLETQHLKINELLPRSPTNLKNLSNFTEVDLHFDQAPLLIEFTGPSGRFTIGLPRCPNATCFAARVLERLGTSNIRRLGMGGVFFVADEIRRAIRSMTGLRTLEVSLRNGVFPLGLLPSLAPNNVTVCPELEKLVCRVPGGYNVRKVLGFAAGRFSRGVPLKSIELISFDAPIRTEWVAELREYVPHVETRVQFRGDDCSFHGDSDEGDDESLDEDYDEGDDESLDEEYDEGD